MGQKTLQCPDCGSDRLMLVDVIPPRVITTYPNDSDIGNIDNWMEGTAKCLNSECSTNTFELIGTINWNIIEMKEK